MQSFKYLLAQSALFFCPLLAVAGKIARPYEGKAAEKLAASYLERITAANLIDASLKTWKSPPNEELYNYKLAANFVDLTRSHSPPIEGKVRFEDKANFSSPRILFTFRVTFRFRSKYILLCPNFVSNIKHFLDQSQHLSILMGNGNVGFAATKCR